MDGAGSLLRPNTPETLRLGFDVAHIKLPHTGVPREDLQTIASSAERFALIIVSDATADGVLAEQFVRAGRIIIPAGGVIYWKASSADLVDQAPAADASANRYRECTASALPAYFECLKTIFRGYKNHYVYSPRLRSIDTAEAYADWARRWVDSNQAAPWAIYDGDRPVACSLLETKQNKVEVLLAGVHPEFRNRGLYRELLLGTAAHTHSLQIPHVSISTQTTNIDVQRQWARLGFTPVHSFDKYHAWARDNFDA